jgi:hypothetical protein
VTFKTAWKRHARFAVRNAIEALPKILGEGWGKNKSIKSDIGTANE